MKGGGGTVATTVEGRERGADPTTLVEEVEGTVVITLVGRGAEAKTLGYFRMMLQSHNLKQERLNRMCKMQSLQQKIKR